MASHSPRTAPRRRVASYAEASPRTLVGLHKADVQLQKKLDKLDRQAHTAVSNISSNQQAMKMSWRRLEAQRGAASPSVGRRPVERLPCSAALSRRGPFSSNTHLYVSGTPEVYSGRSGKETLAGSNGTYDQPHPFFVGDCAPCLLVYGRTHHVT